VTPCPRPLDPIDAEAVAAGAEPVLAPDAAVHAAECPSCGELVASGVALSEALEGLSGSGEPISGLSERVTRLRAFSRRERRTYALWRAPLALEAILVAGGFALLALPALSAADQASVGAAAVAPLLALARSAAQWAIESLRVAPSGLEALSEGLRRNGALGPAALLLLVPTGLGLSRVLSRIPGRK
jgi:hypothetical protein